MAFERIRSGIASLDSILDNIRLGDNVVIQVGSLEDFRRMAAAFAGQAIADGREVCYIRFAEHEPILGPREGLRVYSLDASAGFEAFTVELHGIIGREGRGAFYVFDCLSDLQTAWATDLMMGNFFSVTCPYLFDLDTVAYFPILRGHHDYATIARIQGTTQLLLDIHSDGGSAYLHPIKVWRRYSSDMFLPHKLTPDGEFISLTDSIDLADYYRLIHAEQQNRAELNIDSYERFFKEAREAFDAGKLERKTLERIISGMLTHDPGIAAMAAAEFSPGDFFFIKERMIGTGTIGGKACGMLLSRKIVENHDPEAAPFMEPHDSFYIGTDVFYSFLVENGLWSLRRKGRGEEDYFASGKELSDAILNGHFSPAIRAQFSRMLEYFGQIPIIVRSSSFLEDSFGSAFAGKYESVFCANAVSPEDRLRFFEDAVRRVYASTMDRSALEYRRKRGMAGADEQMAVLVQRVSGTRFGDHYMPCAAGVGFSYSLYRWSGQLRSDAGLLRLVAGLGTKAVDRTGRDYPRLVNLDRPESTTYQSEADRHRFSQHYLDAINLRSNTFEELPVEDLIPTLPQWYTDIICEHDTAAERTLGDAGRYRPVLFISCRGVARMKKLMDLMKGILAVLQQRYGTPVDIEFTVNFSAEGSFVINLLQCRPLYVWQETLGLRPPKASAGNILFRVHGTFMGNSAKIGIGAAVVVDAGAYGALPYNRKSLAADAIGRINRHYKDSGMDLMLISPGRIGTSSPELGVPVRFSDISNFKVLCEYEDADIGFVPELSFGSHLFQDLVESEMFYVAIMPGTGRSQTVFRKDFWHGMVPADIGDAYAEGLPPGIIRVYEMQSGKPLNLYADFKGGTVTCGFF